MKLIIVLFCSFYWDHLLETLLTSDKAWEMWSLLEFFVLWIPSSLIAQLLCSNLESLKCGCKGSGLSVWMGAQTMGGIIFMSGINVSDQVEWFPSADATYCLRLDTHLCKLSNVVKLYVGIRKGGAHWAYWLVWISGWIICVFGLCRAKCTLSWITARHILHPSWSSWRLDWLRSCFVSRHYSTIIDQTLRRTTLQARCQ